MLLFSIYNDFNNYINSRIVLIFIWTDKILTIYIKENLRR